MTVNKGNSINQDKFAQHLGICVLKAEGGEAIAEITIKEEHVNGLGTTHGAIIFALADIAFAAACNSESDAIGLQADIRYLNKPEGKKLIAHAYELNASRKIGNYQVDVLDETEQKVAQFSGIAYRF